MISAAQIKQILAKAVYAPSGDNSQPWHFVFENGKLSVFNYRDKDLPFYNYRQCGSYVAHGALIENISLLAKDLGFECRIALFPEGSQAELVAILDFIETADRKSDPLANYIDKRTTNRLPYSDQIIGQEIQAKLLDSNNIKGIEIRIIENKEKIKKISHASVVNEMTVLTTKAIHNYFFKHVVWSEPEERKKRSGLYVKTLEMPKPQEIAFRLASFWPIMKIADTIGITKKIADDNANLFAQSSLLAVFLSDNDQESDFIALGRSLQRVWLACTKEGLAVHPITGVLFLNQLVKSGATSEIKKSQQELIKRSYSEISEQCDPAGKQVLFILRLGKAGAPSATSSRLDPVIDFKGSV